MTAASLSSPSIVNGLLDSARILDFEVPYTRQQIDDACRQICQGNEHRQRLRPSGRLARRRDDGRVGSKNADQRRHRGVGLAGVFHSRGAHAGNSHDLRQVVPPRASDRADPKQGSRSLYDLHAVQACRGGGGLQRRAHARLPRPDCRGHRCQFLHGRERRNPHPDPRLFSQRESPGARSSISLGAVATTSSSAPSCPTNWRPPTRPLSPAPPSK